MSLVKDVLLEDRRKKALLREFGRRVQREIAVRCDGHGPDRDTAHECVQAREGACMPSELDAIARLASEKR